MNIENYLSKQKSNVIVCSYPKRKYFFSLVSNDNFLYDLKFIDFADLERACIGSYSLDATKALVDKYGFDFKKASNIARNSLISRSPYKDEIGKYYEKDDDLLSYLKDVNLIIDQTTSFNNFIYKSLCVLDSLNIVYQKIEYPIFDYANRQYKEYPNCIAEVEGAAEYISSLLSCGVSPDNICLYFPIESTLSIIDDVFPFYNIPYSFKKHDKLSSNDFVIELIKKYHGSKTSSEQILKDVNEASISNSIKEAISTCLSNYESSDFGELEFLFDTVSLFEYDSKNVVRCCSDLEFCSGFDYLVVLNAVSKSLPRIFIEDGMIESSLLEYNLLSESHVNDHILNSTLDILLSSKNLYVSSFIKGFDKDYTKSFILEKIPFNKSSNCDSTIESRYSLKRDCLNYLKSYDLFLKYSQINSTLKKFTQKKEDFLKERKEYDSQVFLSDKDTMLSLLKNTLRISPTTIESYVSCPYKYYLDKVLKLKKFDVGFSNYIGTYFHDYIKYNVLEEFDNDILEQYTKNYIENNKNIYSLNEKEKFYFDIFKSRFKDYLEIINNYFKDNDLNIYATEMPLEDRQKRLDLNIICLGTADVIVANGNDIIICDYKTGSHSKIDTHELTGLQPMIYFELFKRSINPDANFKAFIYINIKQNTNVIDNYVKFEHIEAVDPEIIEERKEKCLSTFGLEDIDNLLEVTKKALDEIPERILNMCFKYKPFSDSCRYCSYSTICNKNIESEFTDLPEDNDYMEGEDE